MFSSSFFFAGGDNDTGDGCVPSRLNSRAVLIHRRCSVVPERPRDSLLPYSVSLARLSFLLLCGMEGRRGYNNAGGVRRGEKLAARLIAPLLICLSSLFFRPPSFFFVLAF